MRWCALQYCAERPPQGRNAPVHMSAVVESADSVLKKPSSQETTWELFELVQVRVTPFAIGVHAATADQQGGGQIESTSRGHG